MNSEEFINRISANPSKKDMDQLKGQTSNTCENIYEDRLKRWQPELSDIMPDHSTNIAETKQLRKDLDVQLQNLKNAFRQSPERAIAITKLQEAIMWLGMDMKDMGTESPYPQSYNPQSNIVEPPADGLKL